MLDTGVGFSLVAEDIVLGLGFVMGPPTLKATGTDQQQLSLLGSVNLEISLCGATTEFEFHTVF